MRTSDFDLLIVPRLGGAAAGDWPSRWRAKLSTARFVAPKDPGDRRPERWIDAAVKAASDAARPVLFIGHGLGAATIAAASKALNRADVRGALLVAPPDDAALIRLGGDAWQRTHAPLPWRSVVIASRNDPEGAYDAVAALANDWGAHLIDAGLAGGIDAASGHGPWPEGLMRLAGFIKDLGAKKH
jgi:predicted alpha/beta hydrolase family esterase